MCSIYLFILRIPFCLNWADWAEVAVTSVSVSATAEFPLGLALSKQKTPEPVTSCQEVARPTNSTTPGVSSHRDLSLYLRGRAGPNDVQCVHVCVRVRALAKNTGASQNTWVMRRKQHYLKPVWTLVRCVGVTLIHKLWLNQEGRAEIIKVERDDSNWKEKYI